MGAFELPPGRVVTLPDRGDMWVWDAPGPPGAPTVVLLHGWTSTAALNWCASFKKLSKRFRVIAPDHRGHGRGILSREPFRLADCADDVAALVEVLGLDSVTAVGYSMGGPVASLVWRRHPEVVDGLVLCATAARFGSRRELIGAVTALGYGLSLAVERIPPTVLRQSATQLARLLRPEGAEELDPWVITEMQGGHAPAFIQAGVALNSFDATGWMPEIDVPTAVLITTQDRTVAPYRQWWLANSIPGATAYEVDADHRACVEAARTFVPTLLEACLQVTGTRSSRAG